MKKFVSVLLVLFIFACLLPAAAIAKEEEDFTVSGAFSEDMVLQRDGEVPIWGWSSHHGATITVSFKGSTATATVGDGGEWLAKLPAMAADANPADMVISSDISDYTVTLTDILVGDVWIISGQSNAELTINSVLTEYPTIRKDFNPDSKVRLFMQARANAIAKAEYMASPQQDVIVSSWKWRKEGATTVNFSALGYFFASELSARSDMPIGIIMTASGGSPLAELMPKELADSLNYANTTDKSPVGGMYNALMAPFQKMSIKGMIFYQGESEQGIPEKYPALMKAYVEELRKRFDKNFPFYYVQLSSHGGQALTNWKGIANLRAAQFDALSTIDNAWMAVSMDMGYRDGDPDWAHPLYKKPVGQRLAAIALARDYGIGDINYVSSPMPAYAYKTADGIAVKFNYVGDGLKVLGDKTTLQGFNMISPTGALLQAEATIISKDTVLLKGISDAVGVGYANELLAFNTGAETPYVANLGNSNDMPAPTFKLLTILSGEPTPSPDPAATTEAQPTATDGANTNNTAALPLWIWAVLGLAVCGAGAMVLLALKKR